MADVENILSVLTGKSGIKAWTKNFFSKSFSCITRISQWESDLLIFRKSYLKGLFPFLLLGDTFSSSSSTTPMGSQESLSSHSSEKNGLSQTSPPSSPAAEPSSPSSKQSSPAAASSCSLPQNGKGQKPPTDSASSPHLLPSASWTSTQLTPTQQTSSVSSSTSSLLSAVEKSIKRNSVDSLASGKESRSPSRASTSTSSAQNSSVERASSLREAGPVQRVASVSSLKSTHSVDGRNAPSVTVTDTKVSDSTSPRQLRTAYRTASSSSSSSSSLFPYRLSTSSSLTSLHISEGA